MFGRRDVPQLSRRGRLVARRRRRAALATRLVAGQDTAAIAGRVTAGDELLVRGALVGVRRQLIAPARRLIIIRGRLILIARQLATIVRGLLMPAREHITIVSAAITTLRRPIARLRCSVAITAGRLGHIRHRRRGDGRARQSDARPTARRTRLNCRHREPFSPPSSQHTQRACRQDEPLNTLPQSKTQNDQDPLGASQRVGEFRAHSRSKRSCSAAKPSKPTSHRSVDPIPSRYMNTLPATKLVLHQPDGMHLRKLSLLKGQKRDRDGHTSSIGAPTEKHCGKPAVYNAESQQRAAQKHPSTRRHEIDRPTPSANPCLLQLHRPVSGLLVRVPAPRLDLSDRRRTRPPATGQLRARP